MNRSNTAVCYYAMDFAEESLKLEHLAVRFKLEETLKQFKEVFLKCQEELRNKTSSNEQEVTNSNVRHEVHGIFSCEARQHSLIFRLTSVKD